MADITRISVIIPAHNAAATLPRTLAALTSAHPAPYEIIVVDDGSSDQTAELAESIGVCVLRLGKNIGAAAAKNRGANAATGEILFFTDSDIIVPCDVIARVCADFTRTACDGVVGLLDEKIPSPDFASQFKNLWMNYTYARLAGLSRLGLFYTSAAAIRRQVFLNTGGFDENYRGASIAEDTEFGQRAWGAGVTITLDPELRVVHLKQYTIATVLRDDFRRARALSLMRLRKWGEPFFTSVPIFYQLAVPTLYLTIVCGFLALGLQNVTWLFLTLIGLVAFYVLNLSLIQFLFAKRGLAFALKSALLLPLDVFVVGLGMLSALYDFARGSRY